MKRKSMSISGKTDNSGKLFVINKEEMNEFFSKWPNHRVVMVATVYAEGSTGSQIGYYNNKIVPDFRDAFKEQGELLTLKQTDERLREMYPGCHEEVPRELAGGFQLERIKRIEDLSLLETIEFIDYLRIVGVTEYKIIIEDPRRL